MKNHFFIDLFAKRYAMDWAELLDWLLDDSKFDGWDRFNMAAYTKAIKRIDGFQKINYFTGAASSLAFPKQSSKSFIVIMQTDGSESRELLRHIRNGIAHGCARIRKFKNSPEVIEIKDYGKNKKHGESSGQTAYIQVKMELIKRLYDVYRMIKKSRRTSYQVP